MVDSFGPRGYPQWHGLAPLLQETASFYRTQLHRHAEAVAYLHYRGLRSPEVIEHMRMGYAPGGCLRGWLTQLGYPFPALRQAGLVSAAGYDTHMHRRPVISSTVARKRKWKSWFYVSRPNLGAGSGRRGSRRGR